MKTVSDAVDLSRPLGVLLHPFSGLWPATPATAALWLHVAISTDSMALLISLSPFVMFRLTHVDPIRLHAATRTVMRWLKRGLWAGSAVTIGMAGASLFSGLPAVLVLVAAHATLTALAVSASALLLLAPQVSAGTTPEHRSVVVTEFVARTCAMVELYCIVADRPTLAFQAALATLVFWLAWHVLAADATARAARAQPGVGQPDDGADDAFLYAAGRFNRSTRGKAFWRPANRSTKDLRDAAQSATIIAFPTQDRLAGPKQGANQGSRPDGAT